jgi:hypothetical protein
LERESFNSDVALLYTGRSKAASGVEVAGRV